MWLLFVVLVLMYILFNERANKASNENFEGVSVENPFTNLSCIVGADGSENVFKISPSMNVKGATTIHTLLHPSNKQPVKKGDFLDAGDTVACDEARFSTYYVKKLRDPTSNTKGLFSAINKSATGNNKSTWASQECTVSDMKNSDHWCGKVYRAINDNPELCNPDNKNYHTPPKFCATFKDVQAFVNSNNNTGGPLINYLKNQGNSCYDSCVRGAGAISQSYTDASGKVVCLKDGGVDASGACNGTPLFTFDSKGNVVDNWSPGCKRCASRASNSADKQALANSPWSQKFTGCLSSCAV